MNSHSAADPSPTSTGDSGSSLSIILLMYNEEQAIGATIAETIEFCRQTLKDWEILVIDDGSTDRSPAIVAQLANDEPRIQLITHSQNRGMGAGMATGIRSATKAYLVFNAADGQVAADEIAKLRMCLHDGVDVVLSTYANGRESLARSLMSKGFRAYLRLLLGVRFPLEGLYLFPTALAKEIEPNIGADTFLYSFLLIQEALDRGARVASTELVCKPRKGGNSKVANPRRIAKIAVEVLRQSKAKRKSRSRESVSVRGSGR